MKRQFFFFMAIFGLSACKQVKTNADKTNNKPAAEKYANISGEYDAINNTEKSMASATLAYIGDNKIKFELVTATESGCVGEVKGVAIIGTDGIATYSAKDCQLLTFKFDSPKLSITEENCDLHGARCDFEGEYLKAK